MDSKPHTMGCAPEFDLLEQLDGASLPYAVVEQIFDGDRVRTLGALRHMVREYKLEVKIEARSIEPWELAVWQRLPYEPATEEALARVSASITRVGLDWLAHGPQ